MRKRPHTIQLSQDRPALIPVPLDGKTLLWRRAGKIAAASKKNQKRKKS